MTDDVHPSVAEVLHRAEQLQTLVAEALAKRESRTATAADVDHGVEVTLDASGHSTVVFPDLVRADRTVRDRVRTAHRTAADRVEESRIAEAEWIETVLADITRPRSSQPGRG